MKKTIKKEVTLCDGCGKETDYNYSCDTCGKEFCYECQKTAITTYSEGVYHSSSNDGLYCLSCNAEHKASGGNRRWNSYQVIASLGLEARAWQADFERRKEIAEMEVKASIAK